MSNIVRSWKDETYRQSLSSEEQTLLPANPAGEIELTDLELAAIYGTSDDDQQQPTNDIGQSVDQKAAATYGSKIAEFSAVWCFAKNDADLKAKIKSPEDDYSQYYSGFQEN